MKLQALRPRLNTAPGRLAQAMTMPVDRLRGSKAVSRRRRYLDEHPLCCRCDEAGQVTAATVPDHRVPLWAGGADDLEKNGDALCTEHHGAKTACEARMRAAGGWLATACVCGQHRG